MFVCCCCVLRLLDQVVAAMHAYVTQPRTSWVREWPAMVVLAVSQIFWARGVEEAVAAGSLQVGRHCRDQLGLS